VLTSKILQRIKDTYGLRMTWNLGVIRLIFRVDDGGFELHRKVPYDYDSEFQDLHMKIASALCDGHITIHEALNFQTEVKDHVHTARCGVFLRDFPGRLIVYPGLAATCAVIFFSGSWRDAGIAALCGLATGMLEFFLCWIGGEAKVLIDIGCGTITGIIGGLFYRFGGESSCLSSIFLGTLYWYFYGTAFVLGLLEIIAGELETGVTRFMAVSIKTFVLCLGASFGLLLTSPSPADIWSEQSENCGSIDLGAQWWRIPLYLACSVFALAQYRFPVVSYWRGLTVQLVAYEVQYQVFEFFKRRSSSEALEDNIDTMASNILGAAAAVVTACLTESPIDVIQQKYYAQLLQRGKHRDDSASRVDDVLYAIVAAETKFSAKLNLGRKAEVEKIELEKKLRRETAEIRDPGNPRTKIELSKKEEDLLIDTIITAESINVWAMLMPAVYQLVPGSMIAKLWFNSIFPPPLITKDVPIEGTNFTYHRYELDSNQDDVFSNLMVISCSLALGLIVGFAFVQLFQRFYNAVAFWESDERKEARNDERAKLQGMYAATKDVMDDPETDGDEVEYPPGENGFNDEEGVEN